MAFEVLTFLSCVKKAEKTAFVHCLLFLRNSYDCYLVTIIPKEKIVISKEHYLSIDNSTSQPMKCHQQLFIQEIQFTMPVILEDNADIHIPIERLFYLLILANG